MTYDGVHWGFEPNLWKAQIILNALMSQKYIVVIEVCHRSQVARWSDLGAYDNRNYDF